MISLTRYHALLPVAAALAVAIGGAQAQDATTTIYDTIDGYECFRNLDSTIQSMIDLSASHPDLATTTDVGESQIKSSGVGEGYAIYAMNITAPWLSSSSSAKGRMMITSGVHAREYAPPELALRFAEYLLDGYGTDSDVTWLLRHTEIHLILQVNPDSRYVAENTNNQQRKNMNSEEGGGNDNGGCMIGVDINRNFDFMWGDTSGGSSSDDPCGATYHGPSPESESETQAVAQYARELFPKGQRKDDPTTASGDDIMGVFVDIHASGGQVYFPWGYADKRSPDDDALQALGRKVAHSPGYDLWGPGSPDFEYTASGDSTDYMYGVLGVAAFGLEIGEDKHEDCELFAGTILPDLLPSLLYAAKIAKKPFSLVKGPDIIDLVVSSTNDWNLMKVTVVASDSQMVSDHSTGEQGVAKVQLYVDVHPDDYADGDLTFDMIPSSKGEGEDETEAQTFGLEMVLPQGLASGKHTLFAQATDGDGYVGPVFSLFFEAEQVETTPPTSTPEDQGTTLSSFVPTPLPSKDLSTSPTDQPSFEPSDAPSVKASVSPSFALATYVPTVTSMLPTQITLDPYVIAANDASIIDSSASLITCSPIILAAFLVIMLIK